MSKKNKKHKVDYFNMTPEEQMANAEMFHDVEQGEVSFLDALNYKVPTGPIAQSDYTRQIERACLGVIEKDEDETYLSEVDHAIGFVTDEPDVDKNISNMDDNTNDVEVTEKEYISYSEVKSDFGIYKDSDVEEEVTIDNCAKGNVIENNVTETRTKEKDERIAPIYFTYEPIVGKVIIDDGLVPTAVSVYHSTSIQLQEENIPDDSDTVAQLISKLFYYIITCKHPAVIMSEETFELEFSLLEKINVNKFVLFKNNGFVYVYVMDEEEINNFYSVTEIFNMDDNDLLRFMISTAIASKSPHNAFLYNDEDEVDSVMEARHDVKYLMNMIYSDSDTRYTGHYASNDILNRMGVTDLQTFTQDVYDLIENLTVTMNDEDNDPDTDIEEDFDDEDDIDVTDYPDIEMTTDTDDIDQMFEELESADDILASKIETTVTQTSTIIKANDTDSDDDMTVPVIHRRS